MNTLEIALPLGDERGEVLMRIVGIVNFCSVIRGMRWDPKKQEVRSHVNRDTNTLEIQIDVDEALADRADRVREITKLPFLP